MRCRASRPRFRLGCGSPDWSDWIDYTGYVPEKSENLAQLAADMRMDVETFLVTLRRATDFRVRNQRVLGILPQRRVAADRALL